MMELDKARIRKSLRKQPDSDLQKIATGEAEGYRPIAVRLAAEILRERGEFEDPELVDVHEEAYEKAVRKSESADEPREDVLRGLLTSLRILIAAPVLYFFAKCGDVEDEIFTVSMWIILIGVPIYIFGFALWKTRLEGGETMRDGSNGEVIPATDSEGDAVEK